MDNHAFLLIYSATTELRTNSKIRSNNHKSMINQKVVCVVFEKHKLQTWTPT